MDSILQINIILEKMNKW